MTRIAFFALSLIALAAAAQPAATSCTACHASEEWFDEVQRAIPAHVADSVHGAAGIGCHDCHGGNPDPALADDYGAAMDPGFAPNPYRGVPSRRDLPDFCGRCHSDLAFMRRFNPSARVDQVTEYWTSGHGQALRRGDENVATCNDCHGAHDIRRTTDPRSRVYATRVAETCGGCHSDPARMASYTTAAGAPLPIDQQAKWRRSVHAAAMFDKADLSAPTCNDCHGNHGALPPGIDSISLVCGQCHGREAELFRGSPKRTGFEAHNDFLTGDGCTGCHEEITAPAVQFAHFGECASCHHHHGVVRPTIALMGPLPETPCVLCHEPAAGSTAEPAIPERPAARENYLRTRDALLEEAARNNLLGDARFDWLVDRTLTLPNHVLRSDEATPILRSEFGRLYDKFRIGKTHYTYEDPVSGKEVAAPIVRCTDCHRDPDGRGLQVASAMLGHMRLLTASTARAERYLLAGRRGGVEVGEATEALDAAVDSQIELEVLVHRFTLDGAFLEKHAEGIEHASAALVAGQRSVEELSFRRRGLFVALGVIALALVALALKIRQISAP